MTIAEPPPGSNNSAGEKPAGVKSNLFVEKKPFYSKIKMQNGLIYRGNIHVRPTINRLKDELDAFDEKFIAVTDVTDRSGKKIPYPAMIAFNNITYIAVNELALNEQKKLGEIDNSVSRIIQKRKITAYIDLQDGTRIRGTIFIRNFLKRAKDELNVRNEGRFIVVEDVVEPNASEEDSRLTYFVNTEKVICILPINDLID